jgi:hypothetical protein
LNSAPTKTNQVVSAAATAAYRARELTLRNAGPDSRAKIVDWTIALMYENNDNNNNQ